jgi:hypothetical protein
VPWTAVEQIESVPVYVGIGYNAAKFYLWLRITASQGNTLNTSLRRCAGVDSNFIKQESGLVDE